MTTRHTKSDRFRRLSTATFAERPGNPEMMAFGLDADPLEPPATQVLVSHGYTINCYFHGGGEIIDHNGRQRIQSGSVVLRIPHVEQVVNHSPAPRYAKAWCGFTTKKGDALVALGLLSSEQTSWRCGNLEQAMHLHDRLIADCAEWPKPTGAHLWRRMLEWIEALQPRRKIGTDPIGRAAELLLSDLACLHDVPTIAKQVGMAYSTFRRKFHERFGMAPAAWRLTERMRQACSLLAGSSVGEVAEQLGYNSPFAFSTQFHRSIGESPRSFQQKMRG